MMTKYFDDKQKILINNKSAILTTEEFSMTFIFLKQ